MRILQVHKYLYPKAGAERYFFDVAALLVAHGHDVAMWGTNEKSKEQVAKCKEDGVVIYDNFLVNEIHFDKREGLWRDIEKALHYVWSFEAARKFRAMIKRFKPDLIHIHNMYHHLTPSILREAKRAGVPVVMTIHDWSRLNPNYSLFDHGEICERQGFAAIFHRCIQHSFVATSLAVFASAFHRVLGLYEETIKAYFAPVSFVAHKFASAGIAKEKIHVLPYPMHLVTKHTEHREPSEDFVLFVGRLSAEKGVETLIAAAKLLPQVRFVVAGTGPDAMDLRTQSIISGATNVEFIGFQERKAVESLQKRARFVVVPSVWYDVSPYVILEAQAAGKAVLGSRIGGIPDLIEDGKTGFLVPPGKPHVWARQIENLMAHPRLLDTVGRAAQEHIMVEHDGEEHYQRLLEIYERICAR